MGLIVAAPGVACAQDAAGDSGTPMWQLALTGLIFILAAIVLIVFWKKDLIRPGSFERTEPTEAPPAQAGPALFAMMIGCFIISALAAIAVSSAQGIGPSDARTIPQQGVFVLVVGLAGVVAAIGAMLIARKFWKLQRFGIHRTGWLLGLMLAIAVFPITLCVAQLGSVVFTLFGSGPPDSIAHDTLKDIVSPEAGAWRWAIIIGAVIFTPIFEEVLFRGLLQSAIASILRVRWFAVLIASALFTAVHIGPGIEPHTLPAIGVLGLAMGIAYERTGKISVPIAMHAIYNAINVALSFVLA